MSKFCVNRKKKPRKLFDVDDPSDIQAAAKDMPHEVKLARAVSMLPLHFGGQGKSLGGDYPCPACKAHTGWLNVRLMEVCPVCLGFGTVPVALITWWQHISGQTPVAAFGVGERFGRTWERPARVPKPERDARAGA